MYAISGNQVSFATRLVALEAVKKSINHQDEDGNTALHFAAQDEKLHELIKALLEAGADASLVNKKGETPVHLGCLNTVVSTISLDFMVNHHSESLIQPFGPLGWQPVHYSAYWGFTTTLEYILSHPSSVTAATAQTPARRTPLSLAAQSGHIKATQLLLSHGGFEVEDVEGLTPLAWAALLGHAGVVDLLISAGASVSSRCYRGMSITHHAARSGEIALLTKVLDAGSPLDEPDKILGLTPLHLVAKFAGCHGTKYLLSRGADVNKVSTVDMQTALHLVVQASHEHVSAIVPLLESDGVEINVKDRYGRTPLLWAVILGKELLAGRLLDAGADCEGVDILGRTILHYAAKTMDARFVRKILEKSSRKVIEAVDRDEQSVLHFAALGGNQEIVELLMTKGVKVGSDASGWLPSTIATVNGFEGLAKTLEDSEGPKAAMPEIKSPSRWVVHEEKETFQVLDKGSVLVLPGKSPSQDWQFTIADGLEIRCNQSA